MLHWCKNMNMNMNMNMLVEESREVITRMEGRLRDEFPVGMRVLAVDDNVVCLKLLQGLLEKCQYHVTATTRAAVALKLLREGGDRFDMVITDVMMPDMDGFQLLEIIGLEMDLPVIMISACSDTEAVMKGVTHGACDYLVKPIRMEEIKNIWQHVVRRRTSHAKQKKKHDQADRCQRVKVENVAVSDGPHNGGNELTQKRKKHREEDNGDKCQGNGGTSTQKKPRVVWTVDLHQQFVNAVNQLGIDKAVPKKILEIMNVDYLTRENVASHLQKFRLYLKKVTVAENHQTNIVTALGARHSSHLAMASLDDLQNYYPLDRSDQLPALVSFQKAALAGRLSGSTGTEGCSFGRHNGSTSLHFPAFSSSGMGRSNHLQNSLYQSNNVPNFINGSTHGTQPENLIQRVPSSFELSQLQQHNLNNEPLNSSSGTFPIVKVPGSGSSSFVAADIQRFQASQENKSFHVMDGQLSTRLSAKCEDPFHLGSEGPSYLTGSLAGCMPNAFLSSAPFTHGSLPLGNLTRNVSCWAQRGRNFLHANSSNMKVSLSQFSFLGGDAQQQLQELGGSTSPFPSVSSTSPEFVDIIGTICTTDGTLEHTRQVEKDPGYKANLLCASSSSSLAPDDGLLETLITHDLRFKDKSRHMRTDLESDGQPSAASPSTSHKDDFAKLTADSQHDFQEGCVDPIKLLGGSNSSHQSSLDELLNAMVNQDESDVHVMVDDDPK